MAGTMFMSAADRVLFECVAEDSWDGDVASPSGAWTNLMLDGVDSEWPLVARTVARLAGEGYATGELESINYSELTGLWVIREDGNGNVWTTKHETFEAFSEHVDAQRRMYDRWLDATEA